MFSFGVTIISLAFLVLEKNELEIGGGPILPPAPPLIRESYIKIFFKVGTKSSIFAHKSQNFEKNFISPKS